jgi:hydrogenase maturation protease
VNRVLVAGVGNVFLSDDGFGVEVVRHLAGRALPDGVEVADVGIRGMHLAYRLLDGYRALVLVDTVRHGRPPGTLYLLEHDLDGPLDEAAFDAHGMDPAAVLTMLDQLAQGVGIERPVERVLVVGCEPASVDEGMGLTEPVAAVVDRATTVVVDLVGDLLESGGKDDQVAAGGGAGRSGGGRRQPDGA